MLEGQHVFWSILRFESKGQQGLHGKGDRNGEVAACPVTSKGSSRSWDLWFDWKRPILPGWVLMGSYLVDPASSHMLVSKIKPCMSKYKLLYCETANGSLNQL